MEKEKSTFKSTLKSAGNQIMISILIMVIGFVFINWSAYSQIAIVKLDRLFNGEQKSPLTDLIENEKSELNLTDLRPAETSKTQKLQGSIKLSDKNQKANTMDIPDLNLNITPSDNRLVIPRINQNIPIVRVSSDSLIKRDWQALEADMQKALRSGVVHYPGTSLPGQNGNTVITGHSSYFPWDAGRFKDVFALLHDVVLGDKIVVYYNQDKYTYEVSEIKVVLPEDLQVLKQTTDEQLTLITCTPVGTNLKRLIVIAKPIAINDRPIAKNNPSKIQR